MEDSVLEGFRGGPIPWPDREEVAIEQRGVAG